MVLLPNVPRSLRAVIKRVERDVDDIVDQGVDFREVARVNVELELLRWILKSKEADEMNLREQIAQVVDTE